LGTGVPEADRIGERNGHFTKIIGVGCPLDERAAVVGN